MKKSLSILLCLFIFGCAGTIDPNKILTDLYGLYVKWSQTTTPPGPAPTTPPTPVPVPVPTPASMVVADLSQMPGRMRAEGFHGRDGVLLYALGCSMGGRGWACPKDSSGKSLDTECDALQAQEVAIAAWFNKYLNWVDDTLKLNPQTTATLITNDAVDRFGFILAPVIQQRLNAYAIRVTVGVVVPESAY